MIKHIHILSGRKSLLLCNSLNHSVTVINTSMNNMLYYVTDVAFLLASIKLNYCKHSVNNCDVHCAVCNVIC